jgi:hypothetical protein
VGILSDDEVVNSIDSFLLNCSPDVDRIIERLHQIGWQPKDDMSTTIFAQALFVDNYKIVRMNEDISIPDALQIAYGGTLKHKVVTKWLSKKGVASLDSVAGVR